MTESDDTVVRIPTRGQVRNRQWVLYIEYRVYILTICKIHIALESNASVN